MRTTRTREGASKTVRIPRPGSKVRGSRTGRPIMAALDLIGRRSLLRILWELRASTLRFRQLQTACGEISPSLLNSRLKEMREAQLLQLTDEGYTLTALGRDLISALEQLRAWAEKWSKSLGTR